MTERSLPQLVVGQDLLKPHLDQIRAELEIPLEFPPAALAQARTAARQWQELVATYQPTPLQWHHHLQSITDPVMAVAQLPKIKWEKNGEATSQLLTEAIPHLDATCIPLVTIDPPESTDLDQAVALVDLANFNRGAARYLVIYAIASVATFIRPGSALDQATWQRGTTVYLPDAATPLHPHCLSNAAASLLPANLAPAYVWAIVLDEHGKRIASRVDRALVRSRAKLSYAQVNEGNLPAPTPGDLRELLERIGRLRQDRELARGGVSARLPEQEIEVENGNFHLIYRANTAAEEWNAQLSLLTGISAAAHMRAANLGIMRTLPPAHPQDLNRLRRVAKALQINWPTDVTYPQMVRELDPGNAQHAAFLLEGTSLFRGAGYRAFGVKHTEPLPPADTEGIIHGAISAEYAHVTAPLRRLVDRYGEEICLAQCANTPPPQWVQKALVELPDVMAKTTARAASASRRALRVIEAMLLAGREGQVFAGATVDERGEEIVVMLTDPAVTARTDAKIEVGITTNFKLVEVDVKAPKVLVRPVR